MQGLVVGMLIGTLVHAVAYAWLGYVTDWDHEAHKATSRAEVTVELSQLGRYPTAVDDDKDDLSAEDASSAVLLRNRHLHSYALESQPDALHDQLGHIEHAVQEHMLGEQSSICMHKRSDPRIHLNGIAEVRLDI